MMERREFIRANEPLRVSHRLAGALLGGSATSDDISGGGVSFPTFQKLEPGVLLSLDISLPGFKKPISASSEVVWCSDNKEINSRFLVGAKFIEMDSFFRNKIIGYIDGIARKKAAVDAS
ncbi:MAG: PilZ domain-containing protein [Candidatus Omnitrophica bacterium]|nr:PilZ domain-containing protein [Candidatus Omnitrophota bacterium]